MTPVLSIVVGTRHRPASFERLVKSIIECHRVSTQLVVSDASDDGKWYANKTISVRGVSVNVVREWPVLGVNAGYNTAFLSAIGEYVVWLNDDCKVTPGWDSAAVTFMRINPGVGVGALAWCDEHVDCDSERVVVAGNVAMMSGLHTCNFRVSTQWGVPYANFGILTRKLGDQVGWFDERLTSNYGCDNSLCCRVMDRGYGVVGIRDSLILHYREDDALRAETMERLKACGNNFNELYGDRASYYVQVAKRFDYLQPMELLQ